MSTIANLPTRRHKVTVRSLAAARKEGRPITMVTAYDYAAAVAVERAGLDAVLVGDSLGMVVLGYPNTLAVTMEDMLHHCKAVARGASTPMLIGDMPFMSYQASVEEAVRNAGRFLQQAGMDAVKLEGGRERADTVRAIVAAGIPVMGHIGLTPQSVHQLGGFRAQGKTSAAARQLLEDALLLQQAGCFSLVLEAVPAPVARLVTERLEIPTIGIGAGPDCDGQVLVFHDLLGFFDRFTPSFVKRYAELHAVVADALEHFKTEVQQRRFPQPEHACGMAEEELSRLLEALA